MMMMMIVMRRMKGNEKLLGLGSSIHPSIVSYITMLSTLSILSICAAYADWCSVRFLSRTLICCYSTNPPMRQVGEIDIIYTAIGASIAS